MSTQGFDAAGAPSADDAKRILSAIQGHFVNVYIGGAYEAPTNWTPELVREYRGAGISEFLPTYVGQNFGGTLTWEQGKADANNAVDLLKRYGFPSQSYCALDIEEPTSEEHLTAGIFYANGWCRRLNDLGYLPGVYGSAALINHLQAAHSSAAFVWLANWRFEEYVPYADVNALTALGLLLPHAWPKHRVWQYAGNVEYLNHPVDLNVKNFDLRPQRGG